MSRSVARVIVAFLAGPYLLLIAGCSAARPDIVVKNVALGESSDEAVVLRFDLHLSNASDEPLKLLEFEYEVEIDGVTAFEGVRSAQATLAAASERELAIPAVWRRDHPTWPAADAAPQTPPTYSISGTLRYVQPGEVAQVLLDTGVWRPSVKFSGTGAVPVESR
ncbi:MAG: hypothetical protein L0219_06965 [Phycisphaerales bacterium]|nr:hypothetical protein [Phycisphaerales bacterium]